MSQGPSIQKGTREWTWRDEYPEINKKLQQLEQQVDQLTQIVQEHTHTYQTDNQEFETTPPRYIGMAIDMTRQERKL